MGKVPSVDADESLSPYKNLCIPDSEQSWMKHASAQDDACSKRVSISASPAVGGPSAKAPACGLLPRRLEVPIAGKCESCVTEGSAAR